MVAAKEIGCAPWELAKQPVYWRERALIKRQAEIDARVSREDLHKQMEESRRFL